MKLPFALPEPDAARRPVVLRPWTHTHDDQPLTRYGDALAWMDELVQRPADSADLLLSVQHPPVITVGRRGGREHVHGAELRLQTGNWPVEVHEVARGGSVTYHAPGQLVIYPILQLNRMEGAVGQGPLGDLPAFVRLLEAAMVETCAAFGLPAGTRDGFSGVWIDERTKIASIGVGLRAGWTFHGLALNVCPHLEGFALITPCGLGGVRMTSLWAELQRAGRPLPPVADVEADLTGRLRSRLRRRG